MHPVPSSRSSKDDLQGIIDGLKDGGYRVVGPTIRDQAITYNDITTLADLPRGWTDEQDGGRYRLRRRDDDSLFGYAVGQHSWKQFLHTPSQPLWRAEQTEEGMRVTPKQCASQGSRLSASELASCTPLQFRIRYCSAKPTPIPITGRAVRTRFLSRLT